MCLRCEIVCFVCCCLQYFYSIKDISVGGRCMCNGHADTCHVLDPLSPTRVLACQCRHNTGGIHCNECANGYEQKKWRQNTNARPFQCERKSFNSDVVGLRVLICLIRFLCSACNCFGHSNSCEYDEEVDRQGLSLDIHGRFEGGGVCKNCQHNTKGTNCNQCQEKFYRPYGRHWNETDVCQCEYYCNAKTKIRLLINDSHRQYQRVTAKISSLRAIARKKLDVANVVRNSRHPTVNPVHTVISDIPIVVRANVI